MPITDKGFVFSLDLVVAFIAMLLMASLMLAHIEMQIEAEKDLVEKAMLEHKTVFLLDSLVKNNDLERPLLGSAQFNKEKHRVLANELDLALFSKAEYFERENFFAAKAGIRKRYSNKTVFEVEAGKRCLALDRIVLEGGEIALVEAVICEK